MGVIRWEPIPDYPDYYYPTLPGSRAAGRYLTGAPFDGQQLGAARGALHVNPHFPAGIIYSEMFEWGGMSSKSRCDWDLVGRRRSEDILTFGTGIAAALFRAVLDRPVGLRLQYSAVALLSPNGRVTGIPPQDGGSVTPSTILGDAMTLAAPLGAAITPLPAWAVPVLPDYRLANPAFEGDTGYPACSEHCLPHCLLVNRRGHRFCDHSCHLHIVAEALKHDVDGMPHNLPIFMIWDSSHHAKDGLGRTMPGDAYPTGLVSSASTLEGLALALGINAVGLEASAARFNAMAKNGVDTDFGRGSNLSVRRFRGVRHMPLNPNMGPVDKAPFHGMRLRLLNAGIATRGVCADLNGQARRADGGLIEGLYVVGESSARAAAGVGYNSGYSLSRAMAFGWLAARHVGGLV